MHLPRPKLFRKRQARPDKPIRNFFRRFFCVFALCMTAPQPVTISQDEQIRHSGSHGRCKRQRAPKYEQKMSSGSSNIDSLFNTSEISVGLPVVPKISQDTITQDQNTEHIFASICDPIPLDGFSATITTTSETSDMNSITSDGTSECNKAISIEPKEVFGISKAKSCSTLSESATCSAKVKGNEEKNSPNGRDIATSLINGVIENLIESKENQKKCEPETSNDNKSGQEMITKSMENGTSNTNENDYEITVVQPASNEKNPVKAENRSLDDSELAGNINNDGNSCGFISDFLNNIIESICNKPSNKEESTNDVDAEIERLLEEYEIVSHGNNKVFDNDAEIERLLEDYEINSHGKNKVLEQDKKNDFKNLYLKPPIGSTNKNRKIRSASNTIIIKSPVLRRPTTTSNPTRQNYIYLNETYESNNLSAERLSSSKKFQNNNTFKKNNGIDKYVNETHPAFERFRKTTQPKLKQIRDSDNFPLRQISETINSSLECVTKSKGRVIEVIKPTLGRVIEEKIPNVGQASEHKFGKVSKTANVLERVCESTGSSFKPLNDTNKSKLEQTSKTTNLAIMPNNDTNELNLEKVCETTNPAIAPNSDTKQLELEQACETTNPFIIPVIESSKLKLEQLCVPTSSTFTPVIETRKLKLDQICVPTSSTFTPVIETRKLKLDQLCVATSSTFTPVIETRKLKLDQICVPTNTKFIPFDTSKLKKEKICEPTFAIPFIETRIMKLEDICVKGTTTLIPAINTRKFKLEQINDTGDDSKLNLTKVETLTEQPENIPDIISEKLSAVVSHSSDSKLEEFGKRSGYALGQTDNKESGYASSKNIHELSLKTIHQVLLEEEEEEEEEYAESTIISAESSIINNGDDHMNDRSHL